MFAAGYTIKPSVPSNPQPSFADRFMENLQPKAPSAFEAAPTPQVGAPLRPTPSRAPTTLAPAAGAMQLMLFAYALPLALAEAHPEWVEQSRVAHQDPMWRVHNAYAYGWEASLEHLKTNADRHQVELEQAWPQYEMLEFLHDLREDPLQRLQFTQALASQAMLAAKSAQAAAGLSGGALGVQMSAGGGGSAKVVVPELFWKDEDRPSVYHRIFSPASPVDALDVLKAMGLNIGQELELAQFLLAMLVELHVPISQRVQRDNIFAGSLQTSADPSCCMVESPLTTSASLRDIVSNISQTEWDQLPGTQVWASGPRLSNEVNPSAAQIDEYDDSDDGNCMMLEISPEEFAEARRRFALESVPAAPVQVEKGREPDSEVLRRSVMHIDRELGAMRPTAHPPMMMLRGYVAVLNQEQARELINFLFKAAGEVSVHISQPTRVIHLAGPNFTFDPTKDLSFYLSNITWREWALLRESPSWRKMLDAVPQAAATTMPEQTAPVVHHDATSTMLVDLPARTLSSQIQQLLAARTQREATHILMEASLPDALRLAQILARAAIHGKATPPGWWLERIPQRLTVFEDLMNERNGAELSTQQDARREFAALFDVLSSEQWYDLRNEPGLKAFGQKLAQTPADQADKVASDYYNPQPGLLRRFGRWLVTPR